jgi:hypothetical protein
MPVAAIEELKAVIGHAQDVVARKVTDTLVRMTKVAQALRCSFFEDELPAQ